MIHRRHPKPVYTPEAETDIQDSAAWFQRRYSFAVARQFMRAIKECVAHIAEHPEGFPVVYRGVRKAVVLTLPYCVYYITSMRINS